MMKENVPSNPIEIRLFGADRMVFDPQVEADAVKKFWGWSVIARRKGRRLQAAARGEGKHSGRNVVLFVGPRRSLNRVKRGTSHAISETPVKRVITGKRKLETCATFYLCAPTEKGLKEK
jgi:hypothetical protein